ncbi:fumarylacetoacetate hydrolase family protein [Planctomicrobium sp. SH664]|uniref:fumarylacetoacetate hydrolase family protein n=1 Tax=Planctomicrobium sp. SH664 TaxID=3448125 RepID=UPI003F5B20E3
MKLARIRTAAGPAVALVETHAVRLLPASATLTEILHASRPAEKVAELLKGQREIAELPLSEVEFLAPVEDQEVWAAGVTYRRSQVARMEESASAASHYDKVYTADRPELFFKATARRVVAHGQPIRVRSDSRWSVPEPEFTLVLNPQMQIVGYTVGNDVSARDIEGENPLYLPQAKVYSQSCSLGPVVLLAAEPLNLEATKISLRIHRDGKDVFTGSTSLAQMHRSLPELADWLGKENDFPDGAFLLTGTGVVPDDNFSLEDGDEVSIDISNICTLFNPVVKGR